MASYWTCCDIDPESGFHTAREATKPLEFPDPGEEGKSIADLFPEQHFFSPFWVALALDAADWLRGKAAALAWKLRRDQSQRGPWF
jgi:hypothetical protein